MGAEAGQVGRTSSTWTSISSSRPPRSGSRTGNHLAIPFTLLLFSLRDTTWHTKLEQDVRQARKRDLLNLITRKGSMKVRGGPSLGDADTTRFIRFSIATMPR